jgi:2-phospho-L-lactate/phosphoenolpyruvate guanylyltransferase
MKLWLIVPVKPLQEGKSRLASVLTPVERATLMSRLLQQLLLRAQSAAMFDEILVVSRDPEVWALAHLTGAGALREEGRELNLALEQARRWALDQGAEAILVLPADLPLVTVTDLRQLVQLVYERPGVVLAPSRGGGTSALLLRPPNAIPFSFGLDSFRQHRHLAHAAGHALQIYQSETLAFDVDLPEDWSAIKPSLQADETDLPEFIV